MCCPISRNTRKIVFIENSRTISKLMITADFGRFSMITSEITQTINAQMTTLNFLKIII